MSTHYPLGSTVHADGAKRHWTVIAIHPSAHETFARLIPTAERRGNDGPRTVAVTRLARCDCGAVH